MPLQTSAELKGYMAEAGPVVAETVAARMAELANAVFPMSPMERQPTALALLADRGVSLRGAEVRPESFLRFAELLMRAHLTIALHRVMQAVMWTVMWCRRLCMGCCAELVRVAGIGYCTAAETAMQDQEV